MKSSYPLIIRHVEKAIAIERDAKLTET